MSAFRTQSPPASSRPEILAEGAGNDACGTIADEAASRKSVPGTGQVELICGCMFAGKTGELIRRLEAARQAGAGVVAFKHGVDVRYGPDRIVSHDGAWLAASPVGSPADLLGGVGAATVVGIDEAQFFGGDLVDACAALAAAGKRVVVAGLDRTCFGEPFGPMTALRRLADSVSVLRARCARCSAPAEYTQRLCPDADPAQAHQPDPSLVGDADAYEPRCRTCFKPVSRPKSTARPRRAGRPGGRRPGP